VTTWCYGILMTTRMRLVSTSSASFFFIHTSSSQQKRSYTTGNESKQQSMLFNIYNTATGVHRSHCGRHWETNQSAQQTAVDRWRSWHTQHFIFLDTLTCWKSTWSLPCGNIYCFLIIFSILVTVFSIVIVFCVSF